MSTTSTRPFKDAKRVVTGHDAAGKSTTIIVDRLTMQPFPTGREVPTEDGKPSEPAHVVRGWTTAESPANLQDQTKDMAQDTPERVHGLVRPNGTHLIGMEIPPGGSSAMHRTSSIDYLILISGAITLVLEDGKKEILDVPGSIVVQRGTSHAWENNGTEWCKTWAILIDAKPYTPEGAAPLEEGFFA